MSRAHVAISRLGPKEKSREPQNARAVRWLLEQPGGPIVVVTPNSRVPSAGLQLLVAQPQVSHHTWRGLLAGALEARRVVHAWPDRRRLSDLWSVRADALVVIEWNESESAEWIEDADPIMLLADGAEPPPVRVVREPDAPPDDIDRILTYVSTMAAGYSSGLKWNEEDKLKADMMNRPDRWAAVTPEQVRARCRQLGMSPHDADTVRDLVQRRKEGRRFNVRSSYRSFRFD